MLLLIFVSMFRLLLVLDYILNHFMLNLKLSVYCWNMSEHTMLIVKT
jgi:hypothetical protein